MKLKFAMTSLLVGIFCTPDISFALMQGEKLRAFCKADPKAGAVAAEYVLVGVCAGYIAGFMDMYETNKITDPQNPNCMPPGTTTLQVQEIVKKYITTHSPLPDEAASFIVVQALDEAFACKK